MNGKFGSGVKYSGVNILGYDKAICRKKTKEDAF